MLEDFSAYLDDRPEEGIFRVHRDIFTDPEIFELEQKFIFERTWNFLGIESQIPKPGDFLTAMIARTPILVTRDSSGKLNGLVNACRHKGATVCRLDQGNAKYHTCAYHGWVYDSAGKCVDVKEHKTGAYTAGFDATSHDLHRIARLETYKGLIFGSLSPDVPSLRDFLGDICFFLDLVMEQGPHGMEFLPGRALYTFQANWKMQMDNGLDSYHLSSTHSSFVAVQTRRRAGEGHQEARQFDWKKRAAMSGGAFQFENGHAAVWWHQPEPQKRPLYPAIGEVEKRLGPQRAEWMLKLRNTIVFPNFQTADSSALIIRTFRPISVNQTEMKVHCLAPIGESRELRSWRLRQFEDFFNPSGFATPDDSAVYEDCHVGARGQGADYLDGYGRGLAQLKPGPSETAKSIGINPKASLEGPWELTSELWHHPPHREWWRLMQAGLAGRKAYS